MSNLLKSKFFLGGLIAIALLVAGSASAFTGVQKMGSMNDQVKALQMELNAKGYIVSTTGAGSPGMESMYFGAKTKAAVMAFQAAMGLTVDGVAGPKTAAALAGATTTGGTYPAGCTSNTGFSTTTGMSCASTSTLPAGCTAGAMYSSTTGAKCDGSTTTTTTLTGGAGSITISSLSGLSGEEVGEGEEDVEVMAFEVEADDESDVDVTSVKLEFYQDTGADSQDLTDYADSVSVWFNGKMVGEADASDFSEDNDYYSKSISLDGAVVKAGDTEEFTVAVTALNNLDSGDIDTDDWSVDVINVRFEDADGVVTTEAADTAATDGSGTYEKNFDFADFATSADIEFKVTEGDSDVQDAHVINIDATEETQNVSILAFDVEIEGNSDISLESLPVNITVGTQDNVDEMVSGISLWMDGEEVGNVNMSVDGVEDADGVSVGATETYVFEDLGLTLNAGDTYEFLVKVDIYGITDTGDVAAGDTIYATFSDTQMDLTGFDAQDEAGEDLADADSTGSSTSEASEVRDIGFQLGFVSGDASVDTGEVLVLSDVGTFEMVFTVTPFDGDIFIDSTAPDLTGGATESDLNQSNASGTLSCTIEGLANFSTETNSFKVLENKVGKFKITCDIRDGATDLVDNYTNISLGSVLYALTDVDGDLTYSLNLVDFKTPSVYLDDQGF